MTIAVLATTEAYADIENNFALQSMLHHGSIGNHQFIFISDKKKSQKLHLSEEVKKLHPFFPVERKPGKNFFFAVELPWLISKHNIDVLIHDGTSIYARGGVKQIVVLKAVANITNNKLQRLEKYTSHIVVHDEFSSNMLKKAMPQKKISVIPFGVTEQIKKPSLSEQSAYKADFTSGSDYLLFFADEIKKDELLVFLKAFSLFKKWNRTSMKLILVVEEKSRAMAESLIKNYLYKDQILFVDSIQMERNPAILSAAYAAVFYEESTASLKKMLKALQLHVPLLLPAKPASESSFSECATFYTNNSEMLSEKLTLLYKDENHKNTIAENGALMTEDCLWPSVAASFFKFVLEAD